MNNKVTTIFISSRFKEFTDIRKKIAQDQFQGLSDVGLALNMLDHRKDIADARPPVIASLEEANNSDIFILLLGETYSDFTEKDKKSYTHLEYETALSKGMKILAFPIGDCYNPACENLSENSVFREMQESVLRNKVHTTAPYTPRNYDVDELYEKIYNSLKELIKQIINNHLFESYEPCLYDIKNLHTNKTLIFQTIANKLLKVKNGDDEVMLPTIILTDKEISISEIMSNMIDTNKANEHFINELKDKCVKELWNNPTYRLVEFKNNQLVLGQSDYYKTLSSCDIHYYNFIKNNQKVTEESIEYKQWLTQLRHIVEHNNFTEISASLGCSTLLVVKNYLTNKFQYYIVNNSSSKNGNNTKHVIPSFMFQPAKMIVDDDDFKLQSDILFQVLKEFAEELLGMDELEKINDYQTLYYKMDGNKVIKYLKKLLKNKKATFKVLGVSLDVYRLRPEILTVLVIDDKKFDKLFSQNRKLSWEASTDDMDGLHILNLDDEQKYLDLMCNTDEPLVPPAMACLKLGREYVLNRYNQQKQWES